MIAPRHEIARLQSDFYRDEFRSMLRKLIAAVLIMFILIALIIYFTLLQPAQQYYGNTTDGKILSMPTPIT